MKTTDTFDLKHGRYYVFVLVLMAFTSGLMLVAALFGNPRSPVVVEVQAALALASLLLATRGYLLIRKHRYAFPLMGLPAVVFAAALWAFGAPVQLALLLALPALLMSVISIIYKARANQADEPQ